MRHQVKRERSIAGLVASIAIHVVVVLALAQIVFRYPIGMLIGFSEAEHIKPEEVHFVRVEPPQPPASSTSRAAHAESRSPRAGRRPRCSLPARFPPASPRRCPRPRCPPRQQAAPATDSA